MEHKAKVGLESAIADLKQLSNRLEQVLQGMAAGELRDELEQIGQEAEIAATFYSSLVPAKAPKKTPEIARRVAEAATVPIGGVGLQLRGYSMGIPTGSDS